MVLDYPFVWPLWNAAENSQRQVCKQSLTLSESTTRDGLCSASDRGCYRYLVWRGGLFKYEFYLGENQESYPTRARGSSGPGADDEAFPRRAAQRGDLPELTYCGAQPHRRGRSASFK